MAGRASEHAGRERRQGRFFPWVRESGLVRSAEERWIGGVCGGLGRYLGWSPLLVRALMIGAAFVAGVGVVFYALAWFLLPDERDGRILCEELLAGHWIVLPGGAAGTGVHDVLAAGLAVRTRRGRVRAVAGPSNRPGRRNLRYAVAQWANPSYHPQPAPSARPEATGGMPAGEVPAGAPTGAAPGLIGGGADDDDLALSRPAAGPQAACRPSQAGGAAAGADRDRTDLPVVRLHVVLVGRHARGSGDAARRGA